MYYDFQKNTTKKINHHTNQSRDTSYSIFNQKNTKIEGKPQSNSSKNSNFTEDDLNLNEKTSIFIPNSCLLIGITLTLYIFSLSERQSLRWNICILLIILYISLFLKINLTFLVDFLKKNSENLVFSLKNKLKSYFSVKKYDYINENKVESMINKSFQEEDLRNKRMSSQKQNSTDRLSNSMYRSNLNENSLSSYAKLYKNVDLNRSNRLSLSSYNDYITNNEITNSSICSNTYEHIKRIMKSSLYKEILLSNSEMTNTKITYDTNYSKHQTIPSDFQSSLTSIGIDYKNIILYINNLKGVLLNKTLLKIHDFHIININTINNLLSENNIKFVTEIYDSTFSNESITEIYNRILKKNYLKNRNSEKNNLEIRLFWGDNKKIQYIIDLIDCKIDSINKFSVDNEDNNLNFQLKSSRFNKEYSFLSSNPGRSILSKPEFCLQNTFNPLFNSELSTVLYKNKENENNLQRLKKELETRMFINSFLYTENLCQVTSEYEYFLLLDYIISRIESIINLNLNISHLSSSGGKYKEHSWKNLFPTDSILLMELLMKSIHNALIDNMKISKNFILTFPLKPENSVSEEGIFIYNSLPKEYETHFDVYFKSKIMRIPSGNENIFMAFVVFLKVLKMKMPIDKYHLGSFYNEVFGSNK